MARARGQFVKAKTVTLTVVIELDEEVDLSTASKYADTLADELYDTTAAIVGRVVGDDAFSLVIS
jgi:hypothetical protein